MLNSDQGVGEAINIGSNYEISIGDTVSLIAEIMKVDIKIVTDEVRLRPKDSEVDRLWADNTLAKDLFGWSPSYSGVEGLRQGLVKTIAWFEERNNLSNYKINTYNI